MALRWGRAAAALGSERSRGALDARALSLLLAVAGSELAPALASAARAMALGATRDGALWLAGRGPLTGAPRGRDALRTRAAVATRRCRARCRDECAALFDALDLVPVRRRDAAAR